MGLCSAVAPTFTGAISGNYITITNLAGKLYDRMVLTNANASLGTGILLDSATPTIVGGNVYSLLYLNPLPSVSTISPVFTGTLTNGVL